MEIVVAGASKFKVEDSEMAEPNEENETSGDESESSSEEEITESHWGVRIGPRTVKANREFVRNYSISYAFPLLELFSVSINKIGSDQNPGGHLYGTILVDDGLRPQYLYNLERPQYSDSESESILYPGNELLLTGPNIDNILACDPLEIAVSLMNDHTNLCEHSVCWHPRYTGCYDTPLSATLDGDFGTVTLNYAVFRRPVAAKVEVIRLLNNNNGDDAERPHKRTNVSNVVFGWITAQNSFYEKEKSVLFSKTSSSSDKEEEGGIQHVNHTGQQFIPLSRSLVALPFLSTLKVEVDLWDGDGHSIAKGAAEFVEPHPLGKSSKELISGNIEVKLTWKEYFYRWGG